MEAFPPAGGHRGANGAATWNSAPGEASEQRTRSLKPRAEKWVSGLAMRACGHSTPVRSVGGWPALRRMEREGPSGALQVPLPAPTWLPLQFPWLFSRCLGDSVGQGKVTSSADRQMQ